jgi:FMN phosphatase YigB (HAD superfamily)
MNTVLFDLDGTLLPIENKVFFHEYMTKIAKKFAQLGYEPDRFTKALLAGTDAMISNDGQMKNEERFWQVFSTLLDNKIRDYESEFNAFYQNEFNEIRKAAKPNPFAQKCIQILKKKGYSIVAATNPVFPSIATKQRINWAELNADDFTLITTYENSNFCKPNLNYYRMILSQLGRDASDCLMVGNDVDEDMCAAEIGMQTYLLSDFVINPSMKDISRVPQGSFNDLYQYFLTLPKAEPVI